MPEQFLNDTQIGPVLQETAREALRSTCGLIRATGRLPARAAIVLSSARKHAGLKRPLSLSREQPGAGCDWCGSGPPMRRDRPSSPGARAPKGAPDVRAPPLPRTRISGSLRFRLRLLGAPRVPKRAAPSHRAIRDTVSAPSRFGWTFRRLGGSRMGRAQLAAPLTKELSVKRPARRRALRDARIRRPSDPRHRESDAMAAFAQSRRAPDAANRAVSPRKQALTSSIAAAPGSRPFRAGRPDKLLEGRADRPQGVSAAALRSAASMFTEASTPRFWPTRLIG